MLDVGRVVVYEGEGQHHQKEQDRPLHDVPRDLEDVTEAHDVGNGASDLGAEDDEHEREDKQDGDP